jgi:fructose-1,6-bisphosphatase/sedoheptulose 1,7-bisphosphatase-like protein
VDPLEGTRLCALGMPNAVTVIALAERGAMFDPGPCVYMEKLAGGAEIADLLDLERPLPETLKLIAARRGVDIRDVVVVMLDRPRHQEQMAAVREAGARVRLIIDGDVAGSLLAVSDNSPVDVLWGIGGTPEGVISAAAIKCLGGQILGRLWPRDDDERALAVEAGYSLDRVLTANDLVKGDDVFFAATGVTDGDVLQGHHRVAGDADPLRHRAPRPRPPRSRETSRPQRPEVRRLGVAELADLRLGQLQRGQRAQEGVGHEHVDERLRRLVGGGADAGGDGRIEVGHLDGD